MTAAVWKYDVLPDVFDLTMPRGALPLAVACQLGAGAHIASRMAGSTGLDAWATHGPRLWARVDPRAPLVRRRFVTVGTGHEFEDDGALYVGTFQMFGGKLVFHLFDLGEGS